jgi:hypothetical protein
MRKKMSIRMVVAMAVVLAAPALCSATSVPIGAPVALGPRALALRMEHNAEIASYIARRGYPDWAEEVEVDSGLPLEAHEVRLFYLRLDKEIAFTRAYILGCPAVSVRKFERPLTPAMRTAIEHYYVSHDPARRAEMAAERAMLAAERAERGAAVAVDAADRATRIAGKMERSFVARLKK